MIMNRVFGGQFTNIVKERAIKGDFFRYIKVEDVIKVTFVLK